MKVAASGFYRWCQQTLTPRRERDACLKEQIKSIHEASQGRYGSPRVHQVLQQKGERISRKRVIRLMREENLRAKGKRKFKPVTTDSKHGYPVAANLVQQNFTVAEPDQVWVGDITYVWTEEGWLYLAVVIDLFSRKIIGWAMDKQMTRHLVIDALRMAYWKRKPKVKVIFHSDRGSQYASHDFQDLLCQLKMVGSMSGKGNCYDNAVAESFFHSLKVELIYDEKFLSRQQAKSRIFEYIEIFYNRERLHSTLGYCSPTFFEEQYALRIVA